MVVFWLFTAAGQLIHCNVGLYKKNKQNADNVCADFSLLFICAAVRSVTPEQTWADPRFRNRAFTGIHETTLQQLQTALPYVAFRFGSYRICLLQIVKLPLRLGKQTGKKDVFRYNESSWVGKRNNH